MSVAVQRRGGVLIATDGADVDDDGVHGQHIGAVAAEVDPRTAAAAIGLDT